MQHKTETQKIANNQGPEDDPLKQPDVIWREGRDNSRGWSFEPLIRVKPGTDLLARLNRLRSERSSDS